MKNNRTPPVAHRMAEPYILDRVLELINSTHKSANILDIACGQGYLSHELSARGFKNLYCADINATNFKLDKKKFHFLVADANKTLPYKKMQFDVVISSETIEHLENPRAFLKEIKRILKPGGTFILTTPSVENFISRLYFLLTGILAFHTHNDYKLSGHISILPTWLIERFTKELGFKKKARTYSSMYLPIVKLRFPQTIFRNRLCGWIVIYNFIKPL